MSASVRQIPRGFRLSAKSVRQPPYIKGVADMATMRKGGTVS